MTKIIYKLTAAQEKLISVYQEKWRAIAQSTTPIDCHKAVTTIIDTYNLIGKKTPKVYIYDIPLAINQIIYDYQRQLNKVHVIQQKLNLLDKVKQIQLILLSTTLILILVTYILIAQLGKVENSIIIGLFWLLILNLLASALANFVTIFINFQLHRAIKKQSAKDCIAYQLNVQLSKQPLTEIANQLDAELLRSLQQEYGSLFDYINTQYMHTKARIAEIIPDWEYNLYIAPE